MAENPNPNGKELLRKAAPYIAVGVVAGVAIAVWKYRLEKSLLGDDGDTEGEEENDQPAPDDTEGGTTTVSRAIYVEMKPELKTDADILDAARRQILDALPNAINIKLRKVVSDKRMHYKVDAIYSIKT